MGSQPRRAAGMGLLELLVALLVVSIGLLGLAELTIKSLGANRSALLRARAVLLTADMADRIRAHRRFGDAYDCGGACARGAGGNPVAIQDIAYWTRAVGSELPDGRAEITRTPATPGTPESYVVRVSWNEVGGARNTFELIVQCAGVT